MSDATCKTCPYFYAAAGEPPTLQCRREPRRCVAAEMGLAGGPVCWWPTVEPDDWCGEHPLRQRDRLAAMAMQAFVAATGHNGQVHVDGALLARVSYEIADAMLRAASEPGPEMEGRS